MRFVQVGLVEVRQHLAAAIRWTREHSFRLPASLDKCLRLIDGAGDVESAGTAQFGTADGGLFYLGYAHDLEKRLIGMSLEEFLGREDVDYEFVEDGGEEWDEEEEEELSEEESRVFELADAMARTCEARVRQWCSENGIRPARELWLASKMQVAITLAGVAEINAGGSESAAKKKAGETLLELFGQQDEETQIHLPEALEQVFSCKGAEAEHLVRDALQELKARLGNSTLPLPDAPTTKEE
jgi:hypothetical protein